MYIFIIGGIIGYIVVRGVIFEFIFWLMLFGFFGFFRFIKKRDYVFFVLFVVIVLVLVGEFWVRFIFIILFIVLVINYYFKNGV